MDDFQNAQALFNNRNYHKAVIIFESIRKKHTRNPDYWLLLGACYANLGNYIKAEKSFLKTLKISPQSFQTWSNLGLAHLRQNKYKPAIQAFKKSIMINPDHVDALCNLALTYVQLGEPDKGLNYCKKSINLNNNNYLAHNILGLCYQGSNKNKAIASFNTAIELNKYHYDAYHNLIDTYKLYEDNSKALDLIISILPLFKDNVLLYLSLGKEYEKQKELDKAQKAYTDGLAKEPDNTELLTSSGRVYISNDDLENGMLQLTKALTHNPTRSETILEIFRYHTLKRDYKNAYNLLHGILNKKKNTEPGILLAYANACKFYDKPDEGIKALNRIIKTNPNNETIINTKYSLGDAYDKLGDYDKAFKNYDDANKLSYNVSDINYYVETMSSIIETLDYSTLSSLPSSDITAETPVFITGMPRAGTTLVEQILSSHPDIYGAGEITNLWSIGNSISGEMNLVNYTRSLVSITVKNINEYAHNYISDINKLSTNALRCTDKLPHNFFHIGLIILLFPNSKIIHCTRNPFDTCLSIYFKQFNENHLYARNLKELAVFYNKHTELMRHWLESCNIDIHMINYEDLISKPEEHIKQLINFVDIEWNDACLKHHKSERTIMTPSHDQASKPIYTSSVNRWKNYREHLDPLIEILGNPDQ